MALLRPRSSRRAALLLLAAAGFALLGGAGCGKDEGIGNRIEIRDPLGRWKTFAPRTYRVDPREAPHVITSDPSTPSVRFALLLTDPTERPTHPPDIVVRVFPHAQGVALDAQASEFLLAVRDFDASAHLATTTLGVLQLHYLDDATGMASLRHYFYDAGTYTLTLTVDVDADSDPRQRSAVETLIVAFEAVR